MKYLLIVALVCTVVQAVAHDEITGKVTSVIDGNTIEVFADDQETYKVLLTGIDCPELNQEYGEVAKDFTEKLLLSKHVTIAWAGKDRWGNRLALVLVNGIDIRTELLKVGLAWTSEKNPLPEFEQIREQAMSERRGLWSSPQPLAPWIFRRQQTMLAPKSS